MPSRNEASLSGSRSPAGFRNRPPGFIVGPKLVGRQVLAQVAGILAVLVANCAERTLGVPMVPAARRRASRELAREGDDAVDATADGAVAADAGEALLVGLR